MWLSDNPLVSINLLAGCLFTGSVCSHTILVFDQPPRSTQRCISPLLDAVRTSDSWGINRHALQYTSPVMMASQCKLVS